MKVLVSGASIAGPTIAYWLHRHGFEVTVVEQAPALRPGGSAVDFRGEQMEVLRRMGILDDLRAHETGMGEVKIVDAAGATMATLPAAMMSGEVEVLRGDLSRILFEHTHNDVEYIFGDRVTGLSEDADGVDVTFRSAAPRRFDLVVGADGTHSGIRSLAFGPESRYGSHLGYHLAYFSAPNHLGLDHECLTYAEPNLGVMVGSARDREVLNVLLVFASQPLDHRGRDSAWHREILADAFRSVGWEVPKLLESLDSATDLYFDSISQIHLDSWSRGRVVLLGDAAWAAGPGGNGTGLAMVAAYVLAGELATSPDHGTAFARYERQIRQAAKMGQNQAKRSGSFFAPPSRAAIRSRAMVFRVMASRPMSWLLTRLFNRAANAMPLSDYTRAA